jgi:hypothetical protein
LCDFLWIYQSNPGPNNDLLQQVNVGLTVNGSQLDVEYDVREGAVSAAFGQAITRSLSVGLMTSIGSAEGQTLSLVGTNFRYAPPTSTDKNAPDFRCPFVAAGGVMVHSISGPTKASIGAMRKVTPELALLAEISIQRGMDESQMPILEHKLWAGFDWQSNDRSHFKGLLNSDGQIVCSFRENCTKFLSYTVGGLVDIMKKDYRLGVTLQFHTDSSALRR